MLNNATISFKIYIPPQVLDQGITPEESECVQMTSEGQAFCHTRAIKTSAGTILDTHDYFIILFALINLMLDVI